MFEKLFLQRLQPILDANNIIPDHQFGFRHNHGTPEQCHRIINEIRNALENKEYCSAVFLDIKQAFDRVWHPGLLFKLKHLLPAPFYLVLKSYLKDRHFYVKVNDEISTICDIKGSVLALFFTLFLHQIMTVDEDVTVATYTDDMV